MKIVIPDGDYWFAGFGTPAHLDDLWLAVTDEVGAGDVCDADLQLAKTIAAANEWLTKVRRENLQRLLTGPLCTRAGGHTGRHVALGRQPHVVAAWPGAHEPTVAEIDPPEVLDEGRQAP